jgi:hypothetical protein
VARPTVCALGTGMLLLLFGGHGAHSMTFVCAACALFLNWRRQCRLLRGTRQHDTRLCCVRFVLGAGNAGFFGVHGSMTFVCAACALFLNWRRQCRLLRGARQHDTHLFNMLCALCSWRRQCRLLRGTRQHDTRLCCVRFVLGAGNAGFFGVHGSNMTLVCAACALFLAPAVPASRSTRRHDIRLCCVRFVLGAGSAGFSEYTVA